MTELAIVLGILIAALPSIRMIKNGKIIPENVLVIIAGGALLWISLFESCNNKKIEKAKDATINQITLSTDSIKGQLNKIVKDKATDSIMFSSFLMDLRKLNIVRDSITNKPVNIKNYTHINKADNVDIH